MSGQTNDTPRGPGTSVLDEIQPAAEQLPPVLEHLAGPGVELVDERRRRAGPEDLGKRVRELASRAPAPERGRSGPSRRLLSEVDAFRPARAAGRCS